MTLTDKIMDLSLLWKQSAAVFPYFGRRKIDWDETYRIYLEKVMQTTTDREHYLLMAEFLNLLEDGHTDLSFPRELLDEVGYVPFDFAYSGGKYYLNGAEVLEINNIPIGEVLAVVGRYVYRVGNYIPRLKQMLPLLLNAKKIKVKTTVGTEAHALMRLRPKVRRQEDAEFTEYGNILYIRLDDFLRDRTQQIREKLGECNPSAVILDIRENIGGMTKYGADIAALFLSGQFGGCRKYTRVVRGNALGPASQIARMSDASRTRLIEQGFTTAEEIEDSLKVHQNAYCEEYEDSWGMPKQKALFDGPCVLLTSRGTVSAAEDFTAFFRSNRRAILIGEPTCGTTGTPLIQPLSAGSARICTVGYMLLDGTEFIGKGIAPDIHIETNGENIRNGRDVVLQYALQYLK